MHLNHLLHEIVRRLPHATEQALADMAAAVDLAVEPPLPPDPEETAAALAAAEVADLRAQMDALTARLAAAEQPAAAEPDTPPVVTPEVKTLAQAKG